MERNSRLLCQIVKVLLTISVIAVLAACGSTPDQEVATSTPAATGTPTLAPSPTERSPTLAPTLSPAVTPTTTPSGVTPTTTPLSTFAPTRTVQGSPAIGSEILFLRDNTLVAYNLDNGQERSIAPQVRMFAAAPDGRRLALIREIEQAVDIWLVERDGSDLRPITNNANIEGELSWAPDGQAIAYTETEAARQYDLDWESWSRWCSTSAVQLHDLTSQTTITLGQGCNPAFAPDGRRIAFATAPEAADDAMPSAANAIHLVNRQGENGWDFAEASPDSEDSDSGLIVYAPAWSPDSAQLAYQRFIGYRALVDINLTEMGDSYVGDGQLLGAGAGWLHPPIFSPDGNRMALIENNFSDARGFGGYETWQAQVLRLNEAGEVFLPDGTRQTSATQVDRLFRATAAAWSPDSNALVVALPSGWSADTPTTEPIYTNIGPSEIWRWTPGQAPSERLAVGIDFASPLAWLPPL
ncbi:MAG: hypothetical protein MI924_22180 [Chloroflexales bacterium]|nr:hypothetical protein [Chloroflexales bacterium]